MRRFNFRKITRKVHLWIGLFSGIVVFVVCLTGCIYTFQKEIEQAVYPFYSVEKLSENAKKLPLSNLLTLYNQQSDNKVLRIYDFTEPHRTSRLLTKKEKTYYMDFVNPYDGKILGQKKYSTNFFSIVLKIHRNLFLGKIGNQIIGWSVVLFIISLITGIVLWFPKNTRIFKTKKGRKSKFTIKTKAKKSKVLFDIHSVLGFYAASILLVLAITGIAWTFTWVDGALYSLVTFKKKPQKKSIKIADTKYDKNALDVLKSQLDYRQKQRGLFLYLLPRKSTSPLRVSAYMDIGTYRSPIYFYANPSTGKIIKTVSNRDRDAGEKLQRLYYDIHTGSLLGIWGKTLVFLSGLIGASLPVTGVMMWLNNRKKKKKRAKR